MLSGQVNLHICVPPVRQTAAGSRGSINRFPVLLPFPKSCLDQLGKGSHLSRHIQLPSIRSGNLHVPASCCMECPGGSRRIILTCQACHKCSHLFLVQDYRGPLASGHPAADGLSCEGFLHIPEHIINGRVPVPVHGIAKGFQFLAVFPYIDLVIASGLVHIHGCLSRLYRCLNHAYGLSLIHIIALHRRDDGKRLPFLIRRDTCIRRHRDT